MFKKDGDRALAMADARNKGLKYAKSFAGENGCDTEVVWELQPMSGSTTINLEVAVPLDATTCEAEQRLRDAVAVYYTGEEVVVLVEHAALRASHFLDEDCAPSGYKELVRFSSTFICVATEQPFTADTFVYQNDVGQPFGFVAGGTYDGSTIQALSQDASNPTKFYTGTGVDYVKTASGVCNAGGDRPPGARFKIQATSTEAPASCGSFYWDPLLQAVEGDGVGLVRSGDDDDDDDDDATGMEELIGPIVGGVAGVALLGGATAAYFRHVRKVGPSKAATAV